MKLGRSMLPLALVLVLVLTSAAPLSLASDNQFPLAEHSGIYSSFLDTCTELDVTINENSEIPEVVSNGDSVSVVYFPFDGAGFSIYYEESSLISLSVLLDLESEYAMSVIAEMAAALFLSNDPEMEIDTCLSIIDHLFTNVEFDETLGVESSSYESDSATYELITDSDLVSLYVYPA